MLACKSSPPHKVVTRAITCEEAPWAALTAFQLRLYICCSRVLILLAFSDRSSLLESKPTDNLIPKLRSCLFVSKLVDWPPLTVTSDFFRSQFLVHLPIALKQLWPASVFPLQSDGRISAWLPCLPSLAPWQSLSKLCSFCLEFLEWVQLEASIGARDHKDSSSIHPRRLGA